jgi:hypothetical protein
MLLIKLDYYLSKNIYIINDKNLGLWSFYNISYFQCMMFFFFFLLSNTRKKIKAKWDLNMILLAYHNFCI